MAASTPSSSSTNDAASLPPLLPSADQLIEEEELEWEEWNPAKISFGRHMIAGSLAGLAEHVSLFPIDTIKTHIQCQKCGAITPWQTWLSAVRIIHAEGVFRLWRGVSAMFAGCIPGK